MIKGIDSQIITARVTDYSKDNSLALKRTEINNEFLAKIVDAEKEQELSGVKHLEKTESDIAIKEKEHEKKEYPKHGQNEKKEPEAKEKGSFSEVDLSVGIVEKKILDIEV